MDDIKNKKSLREVLPNRHGTEDSPLQRDIKPMFTVPEPAPITNKIPRRANVPVKGIIIAVLVIILAVGGIIVSTAFSKATIHVTPRQADIVLDGSTTFQAKSSPTDDTDLIFGTVTKDFIESKLVPATGEKDVSQKAQGTIIVYNNVDDKPLKLLATTRFETTDGKIYRIKDAITVPGLKGTTPGSVETTVYADKPGTDYNIGLSDFTLPGLKSDQGKFTKIYARSKTAMTGGFVGKTKVISDADRKQAEIELKDKLTKNVVSATSLDVPADQVLFSDGILTSFNTVQVDTASSTNQANVSLKMSYTGLLFKKADLAKFLATKYVPEYKGDPVDIQSIQNLQFSLLNKDKLNPKSLSVISFTLKGNTRLTWIFDEEKLKDSLKGLSKSTYSDKLADFPAIVKSSVSFRPPWIFTIPNDPTKIEVVKEEAK